MSDKPKFCAMPVVLEIIMKGLITAKKGEPLWTADGSFVIGAKDDKKVYAALPYSKISNVPVLEQIIRSFFKTGHPRLRSILD